MPRARSAGGFSIFLLGRIAADGITPNSGTPRTALVYPGALKSCCTFLRRAVARSQRKPYAKPAPISAPSGMSRRGIGLEGLVLATAGETTRILRSEARR